MSWVRGGRVLVRPVVWGAPGEPSPAGEAVARGGGGRGGGGCLCARRGAGVWAGVSTPVWGAGKVEDTISLMGHALRRALGVIAVSQGRGQAAGMAVVAAQAGVPALAASSLKAALDADWDNGAARDAALARVLGFLDQVEAFVAGYAGEQTAAAAVAVARQVRDQDVDLTGVAPVLRPGLARDRRINVEGARLRHRAKNNAAPANADKPAPPPR